MLLPSMLHGSSRCASPETAEFWGSSPEFRSTRPTMSGRKNSCQPVGCVLRSGTRYWITNVATVVRAAAAAAGSLAPIHFFNSGISRVTADAAKTPALTLAVGAQLVVAVVGAARVCGSLGVNTGVAIVFLRRQEESCNVSSRLNDFGSEKPFDHVFEKIDRGCQWTC